MTARGIFITLEGGEGTGKTTQIHFLAAYLRAQGREVVITREPGGTLEAEKIRSLLVHREGGDWTPLAECLLLFAGRQMHVENLIKPALARGAVVISDRFVDSTRAYQGYGHGVALQTIAQLNALVLGDFRPDMTFIFDMDVTEGLRRSGRRLAAEDSAEDRFEQLDIAFHERMRQGYLAIARDEPERCRLVNAAQDAEQVAAFIQESLRENLAHAV